MEQVFPFQLGRIPSLMPFSAKDLLVRPPVAFDPGVFDPVLAAAQPLALAPPLVAASLPPAAEEEARPLAPPLVVASLPPAAEEELSSDDYYVEIDLPGDRLWRAGVPDAIVPAELLEEFAPDGCTAGWP